MRDAHTRHIALQRYKKKCTFANLPEEKLHEGVFFVQECLLMLA